MAFQNGIEGNGLPITEQLGKDELTVVNNLYGSVCAQEEYLHNIVPRDTYDDLKITNKWLQQKPQERALDARFSTLDKKFRAGLQQIAENTAKIVEYLIEQSMRKEMAPTETVETTIVAMRAYFVGELHGIAVDNIVSILTEDPVVFIKEEVSMLTNRVIQNSAEITWKNISDYLRKMNATEPSLALVKDTYERMFADFRRGYDVQTQKKHRAEKTGK